MTLLPEGEDMREGGCVSGPFAATELLGVTHCSRLLCSTDGPSAESYVVEARVGQCDNCESRVMCGECGVYCVHGIVERMIRLSKCAEGVSGVNCVSIPNCSCDVRRKCFCECKSLGRVTFGASSRLERICSEAFSGTSIESLSIPDNVVELGEKCCCQCRSLWSVTFSASSRLERICGWVFYEARIESLSIPDNVCEIGDHCFAFCGSLRSVTFGPSSRLQRTGTIPYLCLWILYVEYRVFVYS